MDSNEEGNRCVSCKSLKYLFHPPSLPLVQVRTFALEEMEFNRSKWLSVSFTTNRNFMSYYDPWNTCQTKPSVNAETTSNPLGRQVHSPDSPLSWVTAQCPPEKIIVVGSTQHSDPEDYHQPHLASSSLGEMVLKLDHASEGPGGIVKTQIPAPYPSPSTGGSNSIVLRWRPRIWTLTSFLGIKKLLAWGTTLWEPQSKKL